ncbi:hypothetical protein MC885_021663 [Smutsia gigantea]|nr:hypothetical protein MC885_021663 [Smutsia gigantea]
MMVESLLEKFKSKGPITQATLLKMVGIKYSHQFPEILRRISACMELVFGLKLKEVNRRSHIYALVSKLRHADDGSLSGYMRLPTSGLLMSLLGEPPIFEEPRRLIIKELVQQKYLEYRREPRSKPPHYEVLWGARAHTETSKMRVLEVLAKIHDTVPHSFPNLYQQALRDEDEQVGVRAPSAAKTSEPSGATSHSSCNI